MRPNETSFLKRSRHFDIAAGVFKKLRTGSPGVGRVPQSPRRPCASISRTAAFVGSSTKNCRFPSIVSGERNNGSHRYNREESPIPEINFSSQFILLIPYQRITMNTPFAPNKPHLPRNIQKYTRYNANASIVKWAAKS